MKRKKVTPPKTALPGMRGITPPKGGTIAPGAVPSTLLASGGEKGRAYDKKNCDAERARPANP